MNDEERQILLSILEELKQIRHLLEAQGRAMNSMGEERQEKTKQVLAQLTSNLPPAVKAAIAPLLNGL